MFFHPVQLLLLTNKIYRYEAWSWLTYLYLYLYLYLLGIRAKYIFRKINASNWELLFFKALINHTKLRIACRTLSKSVTFQNCKVCCNSLRPSDVRVRELTRPSMVQIITWCRRGRLNVYSTARNIFVWNLHQNHSSRKCMWKYSLQEIGHVVSASMYSRGTSDVQSIMHAFVLQTCSWKQESQNNLIWFAHIGIGWASSMLTTMNQLTWIRRKYVY